jgi:protein arginine kinase activator
MLCDSCKDREAVMRYTVVKDGKSEEHCLCNECASEKGLSGPLGAAMSSLGQLLDGMIKDILAAGGEEQNITCLRCGMKLSEFRNIGRLGCSDCYRAFDPVLRRMIRQIHGSSKHLGKAKRQQRGAPSPEPGQRLEQLRANLSTAIQREEFELAASLRDQIKLMEAKRADGPGQ